MVLEGEVGSPCGEKGDALGEIGRTTFAALACSASVAILADDVHRIELANAHRAQKLGTVGGRLECYIGCVQNISVNHTWLRVARWEGGRRTFPKNSHLLMGYSNLGPRSVSPLSRQPSCKAENRESSRFPITGRIFPRNAPVFSNISSTHIGCDDL